MEESKFKKATNISNSGNDKLRLIRNCLVMKQTDNTEAIDYRSPTNEDSSTPQVLITRSIPGKALDEWPHGISGKCSRPQRRETTIFLESSLAPRRSTSRCSIHKREKIKSTGFRLFNFETNI